MFSHFHRFDRDYHLLYTPLINIFTVGVTWVVRYFLLISFSYLIMFYLSELGFLASFRRKGSYFYRPKFKNWASMKNFIPKSVSDRDEIQNSNLQKKICHDNLLEA